jgi:hypothetical protein
MNSTPRHLAKLAAPCLALLLAASFASRAHAEDFEKSYAVSGRADVHVNVHDGSVRVVTSDAPQVEFRVMYEGFTLGKDLFIDSRQDGDRVELTQREREGVTFGNNHRRVSVEIRMPKSADLQLVTGDGNIEIASLNGRISVRSGDGSLKASQLSGTVDLHTGDGGINANSLKGDLRVSTGDGVIEASGLDGKAEVSSGDGRIHLSGRFDALDIRSGDGGITARVAPGSTMTSGWKITSGDGPVELALPKDFKATLDASTSDGRITLGVPVAVEGAVSRAKVRGAMNGGGATLYIRTGDGGIRLEGI